MIHKPTFRSCFRIEPLGEPDGVLVLAETDYRVLKGHVQRLAPLLNGELTTEELVDRFRGDIPASELYYTLDELERRGYIAERAEALPPDEAAYWDGHALDAQQVIKNLRRSKVNVTAFGEVSSEPIIDALKSVGVRTAVDGDLMIVVVDDYGRNELADLNDEALRRGQPYMLVKPMGLFIWIGPLIVPGRTACWACLAQRLRLNRPAETFIRSRDGAAGSLAVPAAGLPSTVQTAAQMVATETARWIARGKSEALEGRLITFDTRMLETRAHTLVRRPQCPRCGEPARVMEASLQPPVLESRRKRFTEDGGHRSVSPEVTLKAFGHHISPITGIVRRLDSQSEIGNHLVHSYVAGHSAASAFEGIGLIRKNLCDISGGKGRTDIQARVSGVCEAIERFSGIYQGDEPTHVGSYQALGDEAIHPNACMLFSERQYRERATLNTQNGGLAKWIPEPFDETRDVEWTRVWSMTNLVFKRLPTAYCYYGYPSEDYRFCPADSNGNAAGNTMEEAILQGFLEVIERDSVALWWYNQLPMPGVDLESFDDTYFRDLRSYYHSIERELWVLDVTNDLEIPTFAALSRKPGAEREDIIVGFGTHLDPRLGILRALTEMNQVLPTVLRIQEHGQRTPLHAGKHVPRWWSEATLRNHPYLAPSAETSQRCATDYSATWSDDLLDDIQVCTAIVEKKGMEVLVLDQTRPDLGMPVVKVIVPGLRHYWPRFGPGRLYDVPVHQGWLNEAVPEDQLNSFPIFF